MITAFFNDNKQRKEVAEREGPHHLDACWHRLWAGIRLTRPVTSDFYWDPAPVFGIALEATIFPGPQAIFGSVG